MSSWRDVGDEIKSVTLTLATPCDHCALPIPINGPTELAHCHQCLKDTPVAHLDEIIRSAAARVRVPSEYQYAWFDDASPECASCGERVAVVSMLRREGATTTISCAKCGTGLPTFPAPAWLKQHLPTTLQVFGGDAEVAHAQAGLDLQVDEQADKPIAMACPACGAGLEMTRHSDRTVACKFCSASVFLPDELWKRLHPTKTMLRWTLTYTGTLSKTHRDAVVPEATASQADPEPTPIAPKKSHFISIGMIVVVFVAFMGAVAGNGCISATSRLTAPLLCPSGYSRSVVVLHVGGTSSGGTSYRSDLWCAFPTADRAPVEVGVVATMGVLLVEYVVIGTALLLLVSFIRRKRTS